MPSNTSRADDGGEVSDGTQVSRDSTTLGLTELSDGASDTDGEGGGSGSEDGGGEATVLERPRKLRGECIAWSELQCDSGSMTLIKELCKEVDSLVDERDRAVLRVESLSRALRRGGQGKNHFKKIADQEDQTTVKVKVFLEAEILTKTLLLKPGWNVWERGQTFAQLVIQKANITTSSSYKDVQLYWETFVAPYINWYMQKRRANVHQSIRRLWDRELRAVSVSTSLANVTHPPVLILSPMFCR